MDNSKVEQRANVKFCVKLGKSATETFDIIRQVYGDAAMSRSRCFEWHARFKSGRTSVEDDERSGRPSTSSTPENVRTIRQLAREDPRRTIHDIAAIVGVSYGTVQEILTCDSNKREDDDDEEEEEEPKRHRMEEEEEEEDYMSDAFLNPELDVRPGVPMVKRLKETLRKETLQKEKNLQNQQKSLREQERMSRDAGLQNSLQNSENKGFALLQKMGYTAGRGLGRGGTGRVEPIPLNIKTDRGGIGMEEERKRKAEENFSKYRKRLQVQQDMEKKSLEDFRERKRTEQEHRETEADLRKSQRACEQLDRQKGITDPRECWYWPEDPSSREDEPEERAEREECEERAEREECEERAEREECEEREKLGADGNKDDADFTSLAKLQLITSYLRSVHFYCVWCGTSYEDEEDLNTHCPGDTASKHLE